MADKTKQIIVIRKDLKMRRGKECAQAAHASMGALLTDSFDLYHDPDPDDPLSVGSENGRFIPYDTYAIDEWLSGSFTKICLVCNSEQELLDLEKACKDACIRHCVITDNGTTEFNGVPTKTCIGIGPDYSDKIDEITGHLKLY